MTAAAHLPVTPPGPQTARPLVMEARGLVKRYGHVTAIGGADFELRPSSLFGRVRHVVAIVTESAAFYLALATHQTYACSAFDRQRGRQCACS